MCHKAKRQSITKMKKDLAHHDKTINANVDSSKSDVNVIKPTIDILRKDSASTHWDSQKTLPSITVDNDGIINKGIQIEK